MAQVSLPITRVIPANRTNRDIPSSRGTEAWERVETELDKSYYTPGLP